MDYITGFTHYRIWVSLNHIIKFQVIKYARKANMYLMKHPNTKHGVHFFFLYLDSANRTKKFNASTHSIYMLQRESFMNFPKHLK